MVDPFDLIPDKTPFLGFVDDAIVVGFVADKTRQTLDEFMIWKPTSAILGTRFRAPQSAELLILCLVRRMSALSVIRGGAVGVTAVLVPAIALGVSDVFILRGWGAFLGLLSVTCVLVGALAWVCVRVAHFPPALAICLTTLSFGILV